MKEAAELWERSAQNQRMHWMRLAGYNGTIAAFAASIPWKHLPTSCQVDLARTPRPIGVFE